MLPHTGIELCNDDAVVPCCQRYGDLVKTVVLLNQLSSTQHPVKAVYMTL